MKKGIWFALITAMISGFSIFYNKLVLIKGIDPLIFNIIKNGGVAIFFSIVFLLIPKHRRQFIRSWSLQWKRLFLIGVVGGSLPFFLFFEGLKETSAINAGLIHKTLFIWVALMAIPILKERLSFWQIAGYFLIVYGNFFIGGFSSFKASKGEFMILAATLLWSVETIIANKILKNTAALLAAWGRMFFGVLVLIVFALFQGKLALLFQIKVEQLLPILTSVLFLTGYVFSWYQALKLAPVTVVAAVLVLSTPITNFLTAIFIVHNLTAFQWFNNLAVLLGVLCVALIIPILIKQARGKFLSIDR